MGCYTYAPIEANALQPGTGVRMRLSAAAAEPLEPLLGVSDARLLSGTLISAGPDTLIVEVPTRIQATIGSTTRTLKQRVGVSRSTVLEIEVRTLDRVRTGAMIGASAAAVGAVIFGAIKANPGKEGSPGPGGGTDFRLLLLRIRP